MHDTCILFKVRYKSHGKLKRLNFPEFTWQNLPFFAMQINFGSNNHNLIQLDVLMFMPKINLKFTLNLRSQNVSNKQPIGCTGSNPA